MWMPWEGKASSEPPVKDRRGYFSGPESPVPLGNRGSVGARGLPNAITPTHAEILLTSP